MLTPYFAPCRQPPGMLMTSTSSASGAGLRSPSLAAECPRMRQRTLNHAYKLSSLLVRAIIVLSLVILIRSV